MKPDRKEDLLLLSQIADRAQALLADLNIPATKLECLMDVDNVNRVCPLDLTRLLEAEDADFNHDILGIYRHFNRQTLQLEGSFIPRLALRY